MLRKNKSSTLYMCCILKKKELTTSDVCFPPHYFSCRCRAAFAKNKQDTTCTESRFFTFNRFGLIFFKGKMKYLWISFSDDLFYFVFYNNKRKQMVASILPLLKQTTSTNITIRMISTYFFNSITYICYSRAFLIN